MNQYSVPRRIRMTTVRGFVALTSVLGATLLSTTHAQDGFEFGEPSQVGMDADALAEAAQLVEDAVHDDQLRGAVLLVACRGKIVLLEAYGWRDEAKQVEMQTDSLFRMASNAKVLTAAGILALVDEGKIELDDPICNYFPAFDHGEASQITIRHLLTHTSGLGVEGLFAGPVLLKSEEHPDAPSLLLEVDRIGAVGAARSPGTSYRYCNAGYNTLAGLIEKLTGSYKQYLRDKFYDPIGMSDSSNYESDADHSRMSAIFRADGDGGFQVGWKPGDDPDYPFVRGSGGMISSAEDYARFLQMLLDEGRCGEERILSEEMVQQCVNSQKDYIPVARSYGLGLVIGSDGTCSHGGSDGTWAWMDCERDLIVCVFTQTPRTSKPNGNPRQRVIQAVIDAWIDQ